MKVSRKFVDSPAIKGSRTTSAWSRSRPTFLREWAALAPRSGFCIPAHDLHLGHSRTEISVGRLIGHGQKMIRNAQEKLYGKASPCKLIASRGARIPANRTKQQPSSLRTRDYGSAPPNPARIPRASRNYPAP